MKLLVPLAFSTLVLAGCASVTDEPVVVADALAAGATCRQVTFGAGDPETACGTGEQWAEFDRRAALINAGVTCRSANATPALAATSRLAPRELCMTEEQWVELDRRIRGYAGYGGDEQAVNAAQIAAGQTMFQNRMQEMSVMSPSPPAVQIQ